MPYSHRSRLGAAEMLLLCQFYLTLPELQDVTSGADSQPSSGTMEAGQRVREQLLTAPLFRHIHLVFFLYVLYLWLVSI